MWTLIYHCIKEILYINQYSKRKKHWLQRTKIFTFCRCWCSKPGFLKAESKLPCQQSLIFSVSNFLKDKQWTYSHFLCPGRGVNLNRFVKEHIFNWWKVNWLNISQLILFSTYLGYLETRISFDEWNTKVVWVYICHQLWIFPSNSSRTYLKNWILAFFSTWAIPFNILFSDICAWAL